MEKKILPELKKNKSISFEGKLTARKEGKSRYAYGSHGNLLKETHADGSFCFINL